MRIFEVLPNLLVGGGEKMVTELSNELSIRGHECTIITLVDTEPDRYRYNISPQVLIHSLHKKNGLDLGCMFRLANLIKKERPDIVHVHLNAIVYIFIAALFVRKTKYVATIHSDAKYEAGRGIALLIRRILFSLRFVHTVTISAESDSSYKKLYGSHADRMINNGVAYPSINNVVQEKYRKYKKDVDFLFIHVGSIQAVKNQLMLIEAFERLLNNGVKARLLMFGRVGHYGREIYQQIQSHISENIVYLGEQNEICSIMSVCDAFCLSSRLEGMPMSIIEAMSVGCIPIVTPVGGCVNMVHEGKNGFLSERVSANSYCEALERFVKLDETTRGCIKQAAIDSFMNNYFIGTVCDQYMNLFEKLVS